MEIAWLTPLALASSRGPKTALPGIFRRGRPPVGWPGPRRPPHPFLHNEVAAASLEPRAAPGVETSGPAVLLIPLSKGGNRGLCFSGPARGPAPTVGADPTPPSSQSHLSPILLEQLGRPAVCPPCADAPEFPGEPKKGGRPPGSGPLALAHPGSAKGCRGTGATCARSLPGRSSHLRRWSCSRTGSRASSSGGCGRQSAGRSAPRPPRGDRS